LASFYRCIASFDCCIASFDCCLASFDCCLASFDRSLANRGRFPRNMERSITSPDRSFWQALTAVWQALTVLWQTRVVFRQACTVYAAIGGYCSGRIGVSRCGFFDRPIQFRTVILHQSAHCGVPIFLSGGYGCSLFSAGRSDRPPGAGSSARRVVISAG